ncbi:MAG: hypothetical protein WCT20_04455 [Candidatus Babeliales bacterium]
MSQTHDETKDIVKQTTTETTETPTTADSTVRSQLSDELKQQGKHTLTELLLLIEELRHKKAEVAEQLKVMKETLTKIAARGGITFDAEQFKKNEAQVAEYSQTLSSVTEQLSSELYLLSFFVAPEMLDQTSEIFKQINDAAIQNGTVHATIVSGKIPMLKQFAKRIKRDVAVSHSRYCYSFDAQMQQLFSIQRALADKTKI